ncbi:MAG: TMEM165/GDT1 family protein [Pseudomonadota bacterium]|nr:TMEM165/GDT1 family protein [Pseudomonadota bacterium]
MQALLTSTAAVALAEIGDKTQLLALVLATRFRQPMPIIAGIFVATILNHGLAGMVGAQVGAWIGPALLRWIVGLGFVVMAAWTLVPDSLDGAAAPSRSGAFITTLVSFFVAEMGDKTQLATVGLAAAHPGQTVAVIVGTTVGMLLANVPVVLVGGRLGGRIDLQKARYFAALLFASFGAFVLVRGVA